jgi:hypothetical protein
VSTKHLIVCDACGREAPIGDKFLRGGMPGGWLDVSQGEATFSWHVCSWECLRSFGDRKDREQKAYNKPLENFSGQMHTFVKRPEDWPPRQEKTIHLPEPPEDAA